MTENNHKRRRKAIYLLPNLFTSAGLFAGFYAIVASMNDQFFHAAVAVIIAMLLDGVDGRVARMTNTQSEFGAQYDSLADLVSFGLAPALIMYEWSLSSMAELGWQWAKFGWLAAFFYTAMAALRLARFNVQIGKVDKRFFLGLASPSAATLMVSFVWVCDDLGWSGHENLLWIPSLILTISAGTLMITPILYNSFKDGGKSDRIPYLGMIIVVLILVLVTIDPPKVFFIVFLLYALSGPAMWLRRRWRRRLGRQDPSRTSPGEPDHNADQPDDQPDKQGGA